VKARIVTIAKWALYPLFYLFCLALFGYLTFPFDRLKDRLIAEFEREQATHGGHQRLEIDELSSYWFSGVDVTGVKLVIPPADPGDKDAKDTVLAVDRAHARVQLLPLLIGRVRVDFTAEAFDGEVSGSVPVTGGNGAIELSLEDVDLSKVAAITDTIGVPLRGIASGTIELDAPERKLSKATGSVSLTVRGVSVGDGKTKIKGQLALPEAKLGDLTITADATDGLLKISKLAAPGPDLDLQGDGKISLRDVWNDSSADLYVKFKFSDAYRGKNDVTKSLLGAPGSKAPALLDLADPKIKKAKRPDGFYGFHVHGTLRNLRFDPSASGAPEGGAARGGKGSPFQRKAGGISLPLGPSEAVHETHEARPAAPSIGSPLPRAVDRPEPERDREPERPEITPPPPPPPPPREAPEPPVPEPEPEPQAAPEPAQEQPAEPPQEEAPAQQQEPAPAE
jgi:type II secretion system protein N